MALTSAFMERARIVSDIIVFIEITKYRIKQSLYREYYTVLSDIIYVQSLL